MRIELKKDARLVAEEMGKDDTLVNYEYLSVIRELSGKDVAVENKDRDGYTVRVSGTARHDGALMYIPTKLVHKEII